MPYMPTNHSDVPIRLFKSDFLEFFTHIHPAIVPIMWLPLAAYFLSRPIINQTLGAGSIIVALIFGAIVWSFTEYTMHRFVFHFEPKNPHPLVERAIFLFHGVHHVQPQCKTRLVMPPIVSVPMSFVFYGLFADRTGQAIALTVAGLIVLGVTAAVISVGLAIGAIGAGQDGRGIRAMAGAFLGGLFALGAAASLAGAFVYGYIKFYA